MKDFQILRYLKQFKFLIAIGSVLAGFMFYYVASNKLQSYTASTVIEYTNAGATEGLAPDGSKIDTSEIYGSYIIAKVIQNLGIDPSTANMDNIRNSISITAIITDEQQQIFDAKVTQGEDASLIATRYLITFTAGVASGKDYPRTMLNEILDVYSAYYGEAHVNSARSANGINDIYDKGYDYLEMMDVIDESLTATLQTLDAKISGDSAFRSSETGYSFADLFREYELLQNIEVPKITAHILADKVTKNRDILLAKYRNRNNTVTIENNASEQEIQKIMGVIDSYVQMMSDSGNTNITSEYILQDVYDDTQDGRYSKTDQTTSYDKLLIRYVLDRTQYTANEVDVAYNQYIINTFSGAPAQSPQEEQDAVTEAIRTLVDRINTLYAAMETTIDEYNEYLGASNISVLSSVGVTEKISINKFTMLVVVVFGLFGCLGAIALGRLWDIIEYYMFTNKTVNLPNRARCDRYIADMESKMLSNSFICVAFTITNLREENSRLGRNAGNQMMKLFARVLTSVFVPSKTTFVVYNDSAQYLVFADDYNPEQMRASLEQMRTVLAQKCEKEAFDIEYDEGYACSGAEQSFYIRHLLAIALRRMRGEKTEAPKPEETKKEAEKVTEETVKEPEKALEETEKDTEETAKEQEKDTEEPVVAAEEPEEIAEEPEEIDEEPEEIVEEPEEIVEEPEEIVEEPEEAAQEPEEIVEEPEGIVEEPEEAAQEPEEVIEETIKEPEKSEEQPWYASFQTKDETRQQKKKDKKHKKKK